MSETEADEALDAEPGSEDEVRAFEAAVMALLEAAPGLLATDLPAMVANAFALLGAGSTELYIVDDEQTILVPLIDAAGDRPAVDGSVAGQAFRRSEVVRHDNDRTQLWLPLLDGSSRVGVIAVVVAPPGPAKMRHLAALARLVSEMVVTKSAYSDLFARARRRQPMALEAELAWQILPPLSFVSDLVAIAGIVKPAYEVAGDAFDYAINDGVAHFALVDAMGHGMEASRMANLAIAAYRNRRRAGDDLRATFDAIDEVIATEYGDRRYVTGQFARLDLATGRLSWLNAGHPLPLHVRDNTVLGPLECAPTAPAGWQGRRGPVAEVDLQPGDAILFFTDGVVEARSPDGEEFGVERLGDHLVRSTLARQTTAETVRRLCNDVLEHQGAELSDDATLLLVRWGRVA